MPRGGRREGAGGKPTWNSGKTKPVRVPEALAEKILEIARIIDEGRDLGSVDVIDLTGIAVLQSKHGPVVRLSDLVRVGYRIKPDNLVRNLKVQVVRDFEVEDLLEEALDEYER
jgi:hypothetical protein